MTCSEPHWTAYLTAFLTPLVALISVYIAWRQSKTTQNKLKFDLFEKRFAVYHKTRTMLVEIMTQGKLSTVGLTEYSAGVCEAKWLMDDDVAKYLGEELFGMAVKLQEYDARLDGLPMGDERTQLQQKRMELQNWFHAQHLILDVKIGKFLKLNN